MKNQSFTSATFSWLPSELEPIALRLARADECAFEIGDVISHWSMEGPLEFEQVRRGIESKTILKSIRPVPPEGFFAVQRGHQSFARSYGQRCLVSR